MDKDKNLRVIGRVSINKNLETEKFEFAQIKFLSTRKQRITSKVKDDAPFYNPFSKHFYKQKLIYRDEDLGLIIQFDVILMWVIFGGIFIWSVFF